MLLPEASPFGPLGRRLILLRLCIQAKGVETNVIRSKGKVEVLYLTRILGDLAS